MTELELAVRKVLERADAAQKAALKAIPEEYQDYLVFIEENQVVLNREPRREEFPLPPGVFVWKGKTYIKIETPYMVVAGRLKWFVDDHRRADKRYKITTNVKQIEELILNGQPIPPGYPFITVIESELLGVADGVAAINIGGKGADLTHPLENAETSSLGRALAKLGYGLIGPGLASAEEVMEARLLKKELEPEGAPEEPVAEEAGEAEEAKADAENAEGEPPGDDSEIVEIVASKPREVSTSKGVYIAHRLKDGRFLMLPKGVGIKPGTRLSVSGVETKSKDGSVLLWAKTFKEELAS